MWEFFVDVNIFHRMVSLLKLLLRDLDLLFEDQNYKMLISETVIARAKIHSAIIIDLDIWQRIIPFRDLHLLTLTDFFKIKNVKF